MQDNNKMCLRIHYCGYEECSPGHSFGPAVRTHYLMHFITKGKGIYRIGEKEIPLEKGQAFLINPREVTYYKADVDQPWSYTWIAFDGIEADRLLSQYGLVGDEHICRFRLEGGTQEKLEQIAEIFLRTDYSKEELLGYFYLIFSKVIRKHSKGLIRCDRDYFDQADQYIRHNYCYPIQVADVAREVGIDRTYLYRIFKEQTHQSPKQYLTAYRVGAAKDMLMNTNMSVTEIGLSCGFPDSSAFSAGFERMEGMSPLGYRKTLQEAEHGRD